ncbi:MAG: DUF4013 domain-containing protein [bacterium]
MNYSEALSFTFKDESWLKKMAIGGLFGFMSMYAGLLFIFGFFLVGYYVGVLRNVMNEEETSLPEWSDMSKIFVDGVMGSVIFLIYFIVIGGLCALFIIHVASNHYMAEVEQVSLIVFISVATFIALTFFINFGLTQYAATENFASAFSLAGLINILRSHFGDFIAIIIFSIILNGILLCAGLVIFAPITNFWGMLIQAHLFGQYAREIKISTQEHVQVA